MKIFLIHAHKNLELLNTLIESLHSNDTKIYVNLDKKADIDIKKINKKATLIKKRINVHWGGFSQVQAILNSLRQIQQEVKSYEHVIYISGQDYLIKKLPEVCNYLIPEKEYLHFIPIGKSHWDVDYRYNQYHFGYRKRHLLLSKYVNKIIPKSANIPLNYKPYGGSSWWALSQNCINYILSFLDNNKKFYNYFKFTRCSDECFFQTIILNSKYKDNIVNEKIQYMNWNNNGYSPKILEVEDFSDISNSNGLFCRKIDLPQSKELISLINENLLS